MEIGMPGLNNYRGGRTDLRLEGDLTESVVRSGAGGFSVEEDEHGYIPLSVD